MKIFCVLLLLFLTGCGDRYSLDEKRGPDPEGFVTTHPLSLPPDYLLRAPEPVKPDTAGESSSKEGNEQAAPKDETPQTEKTEK